MSATYTLDITEDHKRQYQEEGYFVLENALPKGYLDTLREECQRFVDEINTEMDQQGTDVLGLNRRNSRYFVTHPSLKSPAIRDILYSDLFAQICRATIGDEAYIQWEQYVVKAAERGMKFGWHQDSAFELHGGSTPHKPYVSCWCALDDVSEANGTVYILPFSRAGTRELVEHYKEEGTNDLIGYTGDDPGEIVEVPAGGIAVFSSLALHRSGTNTTDRMRRVYLAQYSPERIMGQDGSLAGRGEPFIRNGRRVV